MNAENLAKAILAGKGRDTFISVSGRLLRSDAFRRLVVRRIEKHLEEAIQTYPGFHKRPKAVIEEKRAIATALLHTVDRAIAQGNLSEAWMSGPFCNFLVDVLFVGGSGEAYEGFIAEHGQAPPAFLVISPFKGCNLRCTGCYADSGASREKLEWPILERIVEEAKALWGARFFVFSGGEPLMYRSEGKGVMDTAEWHPDCFFLMYTNGTLIDKEMADRMGRAGNLTPAISVEGMEELTDERRGAGTFKRILEAMTNLREAGVPFGISITATKRNHQAILSDEFLDFFFEEQRALYGWIFQCTPIGRARDMTFMPTPEQRMWMWRRTWQVVRERKIMLPDFWTFGPVSDGCLSAGRESGYLYIDWNGKVMPCVFYPYSPVNINDVYNNSENLNDVWANPFFAAIREWQSEYAFGQEEPQKHGNWLMPCPYKDHHEMARGLINTYQAEPEDEAARLALLDGNYYEELLAYDAELAELSEEVWQREYLGLERDRVPQV